VVNTLTVRFADGFVLARIYHGRTTFSTIIDDIADALRAKPTVPVVKCTLRNARGLYKKINPKAVQIAARSRS
jgi:hypothetical protein